MKKTEQRTLFNALWIISCKIIQAFLGLIVSMLSARYLGPSNFGIINYAASVVAFFVPIMQLGFRSTLVQEFIEFPEKEGETLGTSVVLNVIAALASILGIICFSFCVNYNEPETYIVCGLYSLNLIFQALEMMQYWFQAKLLSKYTSLSMLFAYFINSLYKIFLLITGKNIYWFAISSGIEYMIISISLYVVYKKVGGPKLSFSYIRAKKMFAKSKYYIVSGIMVTIFQQTDRLMIKWMVGNAATGYYSAAVTCAGMTSFIFSAIIDSMRPVILESKKKSMHLFEKNVSRLYAFIFYVSLLQCIFTVFFSKTIICFVYGKEYEPAVNALRIIVWYVAYAYFGSIRNIWILAENKQKYLWIINLSGALLNVFLNLILIPKYQIVGASVASFITQIFSNFLLGFILEPIKKNNTLLLRGIKISFFIREIKEILKRERSD